MPQISVSPVTYRRIANVAGFLGKSTEKQVNDALEEWLDTVGHCLIVAAEMDQKPKRRKSSKIAPFVLRPTDLPNLTVSPEPLMAATGSL